MKSSDIRKAYIEFFTSRDHRQVPSSPLVPPDDPTLLFTTAGMVQFKRLYSGSVELPYRRACSVQKCLRAGGKGSDLENVGRTLRHHTFFEMLGNFSFGDYFKREALNWAWEFSTKHVNLDPNRIYASVYQDDDEAWDIWTKEIGVPEGRMVRLGVKDNFWGPAGDTGACGPCSELYYDRGEAYGSGLTFQHATINDDDPNTRYLEFWNCVFPQFDQQKDGSRPPLKNRGVDTGMGLERLACLKQECTSPYETDLMFPLVQTIARILGIGDYKAAELETQQSINVVADHIRALTFVLSEGVLPSNEGRGYVMRRLLRRAARYARRIGQEQPFMARLIDPVIEIMGATYPEIRETPDLIKRVIQMEEESYVQTLGAGLQKLEALIGRGSLEHITGQDVFTLSSTYGLPYDDIAEIARERGLGVDVEGYHKHVARHREESRKGARGAKFEGIYEKLKEIFESSGKTEFLGYPADIDEFDDDDDEASALLDDLFTDPETHSKVVDLGLHKRDQEDDEEDDEHEHEGFPSFEEMEEYFNGHEYPVLDADKLKILALFRGDDAVSRVHVGDEVAVVLDRSPFYAESGGQVGDSGLLETDMGRIAIRDTQKTAEEVFVHYGTVEAGEFRVGDLVDGTIEAHRRWSIMRNHTATHLLQGALKQVVGKHVTQQGSYVGPDYLRFDFTNPESLTDEQITEIEMLVNYQIRQNSIVESEVMPLEEARKLPGIIAPFGEKYGSSVRVVNVPDWDVEFCGGTHMPATGGIGEFVIISESAIASGVRRIEAVTGDAAVLFGQKNHRTLQLLSQQLSVPMERVPERVQALQEELKAARKQISQLRAKSTAGESGEILEKATEIGGIKLVTHAFDGLGGQELREAFDALKSRQPTGLVAVLGSVADGRVTLMAGCSPDAIERGVAASDVIKQVAPIVGGSGGGKKEMAQAGGKHPEKLGEALAKAQMIVKDLLKV
ncbi:MAG: alanine--tRNA ligase [Candidatus Sumerlaeaceae bacterium]|nr:alanine--tRNA ligase [Candidatus Sumerlaeaceae bacterium]